MTNRTSTIQSIAQVVGSNILALISSVIVGFVLPKLLSIEGYGFYKTFTLYTSYVGVLNFGLADGIVLKYGGDDYSSLDKPLFRSYFRWFILFHIAASFIFFIIGFIIKDVDLKFIVFALLADTLVVNSTSYFQQISQITRRFKEYSIRKTVLSISNIVVLTVTGFIYFKVGNVSYRTYIVLSLGAATIIALKYICTYRDIIYGDHLTFRETKLEVIGLVKAGFPLLLANICSILILNIDRQFVSILFDKTVYAVYAFAYNLLTIASTAVSAIAIVLYPTLKRLTHEVLKDMYAPMIGTMLAGTFLITGTYFPLSIFIEWFLPQYTGALSILRIILPGFTICSCVTVIIHNYYKIVNESSKFFRISVFILFFSLMGNIVAFMLFKTTQAISAASVITMLVWYLYTEYLLKQQRIAIICKKNAIYLFCMLIGFYLISSIANHILACIIYILFFLVATLLLQKQNIITLWTSR